MADPAPNLEGNHNTNASPTWVSLMSGEGRWNDANTDLHTTGSAAWPQMIRPGSVALVGYLWGMDADATGKGLPNGGSTPWIPTAMAAPPTTGYHQLRWTYSAGTWASAPTLTCYPSGAHGAVTPGDGSILGGHATDTGSKSYIKGNAYGFFGQAPAAAPTGSFPTATDGTGGAKTTSTGAWLNAGAAWQDLQAETDYIVCGQTPASPGSWEFNLALFLGPNMTPGTLTPVCSVKYTWT